MEYFEGISLLEIVSAARRKDQAFADELARRGHDPRRIASRVVWNALNQIYRFGYFHADPHPANLIVLPGDAIGYVDFGIVGKLDRRATDSLRYFAQSLFAGRTENAVEEFFRFLTPSPRTDILTKYLKADPKALEDEKFFTISTELMFRVIAQSVAQIGNHDKIGTFSASYIVDGDIELSIEGGPAAALKAKDHLLAALFEKPENPRAVMHFTSMKLARALFDGQVNAVACIGRGEIEMRGMISMIDNVNRILDRVAVYLS
jgi:hypothetical protein